MYYADLVIEDKVIVEIKSVEKIDNVHRAQLLNYLMNFWVKGWVDYKFCQT